MRPRIGIWLVSLVTAASTEGRAQTIPEIAHTRPTNPIVRGRLVDATTAPLETLSKEAHLILVARLVSARSYLTANQMDILTDYTIQPEQVLAGELAVTQQIPGQSSTPTLCVYGGEMVIDGVKVSAVDHNAEMPRSGQRYLLFLEPFGTGAARYQTVRHAMFEIENGRLRPLLTLADTPTPYADIAEKSLEAVVREIAGAR